MYIKRKVFSYEYDENGEQKLFSTTEILNEESYLEKIYSEEGEEDKNEKLKKVGRGLAGAGVGGFIGSQILSGKAVTDRVNQIEKIRKKNRNYKS